MKAEQVAKMLEKHEEDANRRFDRIEKILDKLDMRMWGYLQSSGKNVRKTRRRC